MNHCITDLGTITLALLIRHLVWASASGSWWLWWMQRSYTFICKGSYLSKSNWPSLYTIHSEAFSASHYRHDSTLITEFSKMSLFSCWENIWCCSDYIYEWSSSMHTSTSKYRWSFSALTNRPYEGPALTRIYGNNQINFSSINMHLLVMNC